MKNVDMELNGEKLVITVDLSKDFGPSKSGKSFTIASRAIRRGRGRVPVGRRRPSSAIGDGRPASVA